MIGTYRPVLGFDVGALGKQSVDQAELAGCRRMVEGGGLMLQCASGEAMAGGGE
jgi:hypothetical protein